MSDAKLTLRLDAESIRRAKRIAARRGTSLSQLVEHYFSALADPSAAPDTSPALVEPLSPFVARFAGRVRPPDTELPVSPEDDRRLWTAHLDEKYAR